MNTISAGKLKEWDAEFKGMLAWGERKPDHGQLEEEFARRKRRMLKGLGLEEEHMRFAYSSSKQEPEAEGWVPLQETIEIMGVSRAVFSDWMRRWKLDEFVRGRKYRQRYHAEGLRLVRRYWAQVVARRGEKSLLVKEYAECVLRDLVR